MSLLVRQIMTADVHALGPDMSASDAAGLMANYDVGAVPVVDDERLVGIVTDRDLAVRVLAAREDPQRVPLGSIATRKDLVTVTPDTQVSEARRLMSDRQVRRLPVVKGDRLVGIVSIGDVAVADASKRAVGEALSDVSMSESTTSQETVPTRGTPERVRAARART